MTIKSMEVGPLARMLIAYVSGHERVKYWVDAVLTASWTLPATVLFSTLGRMAARCVETVVLAEQLEPWTMELAANIGKGDCASTKTYTGILPPGRLKRWAGAGPKLHAARWVIGFTSRTARSPTTRRLFLPPGTARRAMPPACQALMKLPWWARRWLIRTSRWKSCARSTRLIRAWPARCMCWMPDGVGDHPRDGDGLAANGKNADLRGRQPAACRMTAWACMSFRSCRKQQTYQRRFRSWMGAPAVWTSCSFWKGLST